MNELIEFVEKSLKTTQKYVSSTRLSDVIIEILKLKYCCDKKLINYEEVIRSEEPDKIKIEGAPFDIRISSEATLKALALIQYDDLKDLLLEYLRLRKFIFDPFDKETKICISNRYNFSMYDISGNTIYVPNLLKKSALSNREIVNFKFYDLVLGKKNQYMEYSETDCDKYENVLICDETPRYIYIENEVEKEIIDLIRTFLRTNKNVVLKTTFKKISNIRNFRFILKYLDKIVLFDDETTYCYFKNKEDLDISIIDYAKSKIESEEDLRNIIKEDLEKRDVLVKTSVEEIMKNNYRIGFKLYQDKEKSEKRNINAIVDANTKLINELKDYDSRIAKEIDKLINR